jgi:DNA-binding transcriptional ArsR family regulator
MGEERTMATKHTHQKVDRRVIDKVVHDLFGDAAEGERLLEAFERQVSVRPRVHYRAIGAKNQPSHLMQPKVREVYKAIASEGPLTMEQLDHRLDMDRNTLRFAIQVLRQAALVTSEWPE